MDGTAHIDAWLSTPEATLLLAAGEALVHPHGDSRVAEYVGRPFDEKKFLHLCLDQRLLLLAQKFVVAPFRVRFSQPVTQEFERHRQRLTLGHVQAERAVVELHRAFAETEIPHLFLKGPPLNELLFSGSLLRYSKDIDLLVSPAEVDRADALLKDLGYSTSTPYFGFRRPFLRATQKDFTYTRQGGPPVELHWKSSTMETLFRPPRESWLNFQSFHGESLPVPRDPEYVLYLCVHGAQHSWLRTRWLLDIAMFVKKKCLDWHELHALAVRYGVERAVTEAAYLCHRFFGVALDLERPAPAFVTRLDRRIFLNRLPRTPARRFELLRLDGALYSHVFDQVKFSLLFFVSGLFRYTPGFKPAEILRKSPLR